jgi:FAD/FMN-containing dehydrogenase
MKGVMARTTPGLAFGMGRSYGDVCLNPAGTLWLTTGLNHFIHFDAKSGRLTCEAGVLLRDIQQTMSRQGWMLPVTPGTQFVTVGGAIANDVHGKNHHVMGSFGHHVLQFTLIRTTGEELVCSPNENPEWFAATLGGMGLTGVIQQATLQLRPVQGPWLDTQTLPYASLDEFFHLADDSEANWEYTVSWIDCMKHGSSRGLFMRGNHANRIGFERPQKSALNMPFTPPVSMVNRWSLKPFNALYFNVNRWKASRQVQHYEPFFYPLDNVLAWNRMYGPKGFYQYQCVLPRQNGQAGIQAMLSEISHSGQGSFLAVLKTFGQRSSLGMLSFAQPGVTLALDFPNRDQATLHLLNQLDAVVSEHGGRIYMAKDARMPRALFDAGYPQLQAFSAFRDPGISSAMSRRLMGS